MLTNIHTATNPTKSLFIYPGYLSVTVLAVITVETSALVCAKVGVLARIWSIAILSSAVLSRVTTQSHCVISLFIANIAL